MQQSMLVFLGVLAGAAVRCGAAPRVSAAQVCQAQGQPSSGCSQLQSAFGMIGSIQPGRDPTTLLSTTSVDRDNSSRTTELDSVIASLAGTRLLRAYARLTVALRSMHRHAGPSAKELEHAITKLMDDLGSAPKACAPRVKQAAAKLKKFQREIRATAGDIRKSKQVVMAADGELKSTLEAIKVLGDQQAKAIAVCDVKTQTDRTMLEKLQGDMQTMHALRGGDELTGPAMLQLSHLLSNDAAEKPGVSGPAHGGEAEQLLAKTQAASVAMRDCLQERPENETVSLLSDMKPSEKISTRCALEKKHLTQYFEEAYIALTREVETYQKLVADKSCSDSVEGDYEENINPLRETEKELSSRVSVAMDNVKMSRPELSTLKSTQKELSARLEILSMECASLRRTKKSLVDTRDVIKEMEGCADLDLGAFELPVWVGEWITVELDEDKEIHEVDAAMMSACAQKFGRGARAAEVSEVDTGSITKMPKYNCAMAPFLPACPLCGTEYARVCWDSGAKLDHYERRTDCSAGTRAVLCVIESGNDAP